MQVIFMDGLDHAPEEIAAYRDHAMRTHPGATPTPITYSRDYYNLIVYGQEPMLTDCHITFEKRR